MKGERVDYRGYSNALESLSYETGCSLWTRLNGVRKSAIHQTRGPASKQSRNGSTARLTGGAVMRYQTRGWPARREWPLRGSNARQAAVYAVRARGSLLGSDAKGLVSFSLLGRDQDVVFLCPVACGSQEVLLFLKKKKIAFSYDIIYDDIHSLMT